MVNRFLIIASLMLLYLLAGCASTSKMAFEGGTDAALKSGNPVFLMTASLKNTYKTSHHPDLKSVNVEKVGVEGSDKNLRFVLDEMAKVESDDPDIGNQYYLRMELQNGDYVIRGLSCMSTGFLVIGSFFAPLHAELQVKGPGVFYLGHVNAVVRAREGDEFKAGPSIPLVDQAVIGASGGTFDIDIEDQWEIDGPAFRSKFSALADVEVQKALLAPFDRKKAQQWWESH